MRESESQSESEDMFLLQPGSLQLALWQGSSYRGLHHKVTDLVVSSLQLAFFGRLSS